MAPHIKVRNYLWVYEDGELKKRSTPHVLQLLPSEDLFVNHEQACELYGIIEPFMWEASRPATMMQAESEVSHLIQKWLSERWWNRFELECLRFNKAEHYDMY